MDRKAVEQRCVRALEGITVSSPLDVGDLAEQIGRRRSRPLHLKAKPAREGPSGLTVSMPTQDVIFYEASPSKVHRDHIVLHELGHLLLDHMGGEPLPAKSVAALLPGMSRELVGHVLGRTVYSDVLEQEAELMASIIMRRAGGLSADTGPGAEDPASPVLGRFADALGEQ